MGTMEMDLLNADPTQEERLHKLKRLVQTANSFFMDVICKQCNDISTIFSHSQTAVPCSAHPLVAAASLSSAALGGERVTESDLQASIAVNVYPCKSPHGHL